MNINMRNYSNNKFVFADSSFYICFIKELGMRSCYNFLDFYHFALGNRVYNEIKSELDDEIFSKLNLFDFDDIDYYTLFTPCLSNIEKNKHKGEYEIIGLSLFFSKINRLKYVIIDDKKAKNFAKKNFKSIASNIMGTIGFIKTVSGDSFISNEEAISILNDIIIAIETYDYSDGDFICSLGNNYKEIICPVIESLKRD